MRVYSKSIETFLIRIHQYVREILQNEFPVNVARTRFHTRNGWNYPIVVVAIDHSTILGRFDSEDCTVYINRNLMYQTKTIIIKNILRHELAHYILYTKNHKGFKFLKPHGEEYKNFCKSLGYGEEIYSATIDIQKENLSYEGDLKSEKIIAKVKKLLALTKSENQHESELATLKANQLITQYNLQEIQFSKDKNSSEFDDNSISEVEYFCKLILSGSRWTARMSAIAAILKEFFVYPVKTKQGLEITGTKANIENAQYIANFLEIELKRIWKQNKKNSPNLKQKPFMIALSRAYKDKLKNSKSQMPLEDQNALLVIDKKLSFATDRIYGGLCSSGASSYQNCSESTFLGSKAGENLQINRGITANTTIKLLSF